MRRKLFILHENYSQASKSFGISPKTFIYIKKLYLVQSKNFYGIEKLEKHFNLSLEKYVKKKFLNENQNPAIRFLLKYIEIKPGNLSSYENLDLNTLMRAKKYLEIEDYEDSLNQILSLDDSINYFKIWLEQVGLLIDLKKYLSKVN